MGSDGSAHGTTSPKRLSSMGLAWPSGNEVSVEVRAAGGRGGGWGERGEAFLMSLYRARIGFPQLYVCIHTERVEKGVA